MNYTQTKVKTSTKHMLRLAAIPNPNPTSHEEVLKGGIVAEQLLIPGIIKLCQSLSNQPRPLIN